MAQIIEHVKSNREIFPEYLEPDEFEEKVNRHIFFATNGCGDYYCYRILPDGAVDTAKDLPEMITKYYNDEI